MKTPPWLAPAVTTLLLWGAWGLFQKLATNHMPARTVYFFSALGAFAVVLTLLATSRFPLPMSFEGAFYAVLAGACSSIGGLLFLHVSDRELKDDSDRSVLGVSWV